MEAASLANVVYTVEQQFDVELKPQPVAISRVSPTGTIYLVDILDSTVVAYNKDGKLLWRSEIAPEQAKKSPIAIDVDSQGHIFVLESFAIDVHVLNSEGQLINRLSLENEIGTRFVPRPSGVLAAGGLGEFDVLTADKAAGIQHFGAGAEIGRGFGVATTPDDARAGGWIRRHSQGTLYHRRAGTLTFDLYAADGRLLKTVSPLGIPYHPRSVSNRPGDQIFTTDILPDGRIICEIAHRTPYDTDVEGLRTAVTVGVYIIDLEGRTSLMLPKGIGQLAAVDVDGALYFLETRPTVRNGEWPDLRRVIMR